MGLDNVPDFEFDRFDDMPDTGELVISTFRRWQLELQNMPRESDYRNCEIEWSLGGESRVECRELGQVPA
jgi:hypothetical protein